MLDRVPMPNSSLRYASRSPHMFLKKCGSPSEASTSAYAIFCANHSYGLGDGVRDSCTILSSCAVDLLSSIVASITQTPSAVGMAVRRGAFWCGLGRNLFFFFFGFANNIRPACI